MAGPGQHFDVKAHHSAKIGQSSMSKNRARQAAHWNQIFEQKECWFNGIIQHSLKLYWLFPPRTLLSDKAS